MEKSGEISAIKQAENFDKKMQALKLLAQLTEAQVNDPGESLHIHSGIPLNQTIVFIDNLQFAKPKVRIWTKVERLGRKLVVVSNAKSRHDLQEICITDSLEEVDPRVEGTRKLMHATPYLAHLPNFDVFNFDGDQIELSTTLRKGDLVKIIKKELGKVPEDWTFNPRTTPLPRSSPGTKI